MFTAVDRYIFCHNFFYKKLLLKSISDILFSWKIFFVPVWFSGNKMIIWETRDTKTIIKCNYRQHFGGYPDGGWDMVLQT